VGISSSSHSYLMFKKKESAHIHILVVLFLGQIFVEIIINTVMTLVG
jgi:hypothetical protein